jgi:hypothetical protein
LRRYTKGVAPLLAASRAAAAHKHPHLTDNFIAMTQNDIVEMIFFPAGAYTRPLFGST